MKNDKFDSLIDAIREETPDALAVEDAAGRVRAKLFATASSTPSGSLRSCGDFRALIPTYLNRTLTPAKSLLLVDHTHECVACRQALETARSGNVRVLRRPQPVDHSVSPNVKWAIAAMVTVGVGIGAWSMVRSLSVPPGARATVQSVSGVVYRVASQTNTPVFNGSELGERQIIRTPKQSTALLRLTDGSMVELNERTEVSIARASRGTTIHLDRGNVIVHAAKQRNGALYVKTADCEVMVKGTIFAVTSGTKGSRVSVVEGSVKVDQGSASQMLKPGDQVTTSATVEKVPIQDEIAWSRDATQYLAALGALSGLQSDLAKLPAPPIRTASKLLELAPRNTILYAAIPNIGGAAGQAYLLFQDRVQSNPILKEWWAQQDSKGTQLREMVDRVQNISSYLGDEVVLAFGTDSEGRVSSPIVLAEAKRDGLRETLNNEIATLNARAGRTAMEMVDNPANLRSTAVQTGKVYIANGVVAFSAQPTQLQELALRIQQPQGDGSGFAETSFYDRIRQAYASGANWLFCADLERMRTGTKQQARATADASGLSGVRYLIFERKDVNGETRNQATLAFNGQRRGIASWLAAPAPMSTLDFVSPDASMATSVVIQNPGALMNQLLTQAEADHPDVQQKVDEFQRQTGVNIIADLAAPLGGELTFAIDGPLVPVPSWKLAVEVNDPARLEWSIEHIVNAANQRPDVTVKIQLNKTQQNGRTYYQLVGPNAEADYVFVDGYLLAAANRSLLDTAIQNRSTGYTLPRSEKFRAVLPKDANSNFSALVYHNIGGVVGPLADQLKSMNVASPQQQQALDSLKANSAPGLIYAYAEADKISISANGSLFGFDLNTLALPKVLENMMHQKQQPKAQ
jgi:hypothetical protein